MSQPQQDICSRCGTKSFHHQRHISLKTKTEECPCCLYWFEPWQWKKEPPKSHPTDLTDTKPQPPTAAQIAWLLQQPGLETQINWDASFSVWWVAFTPELVGEVPDDLNWEATLARYVHEIDRLKGVVAGLEQALGRSWDANKGLAADNARFNELCDLANPELGPSIVADVPDHHHGPVVHCQCQYDPDE